MIKPHGGLLINQVFPQNITADISQKKKLKTIQLNSEQIFDLSNIAHGIYSPLTGFLHKDDYEGVVNDMRLKNGLVWPIPIVLDIDSKKANELKNENTVCLSDINDKTIGIIKDIEIYKYDKNKLAKNVFGTTSKCHPGVEEIYKMKNFLVGGKIKLFSKNDEKIFPEYNYSPGELRKIIRGRGWKKVAAFQTRNIPHRGHEFLQKEALKQADGLLIQPVIGKKKEEDSKDEYIIGSYNILIDKYFPKNKAILGVLPLKMRYAGPREAIFHALIRKNYGCTHFIVGRDHAGVGDYYKPNAAQDIFSNFKKDEIGVEILKFDEVVYNKFNKKHCFIGKCPKENIVKFSGTKIRNKIKNQEPIEPYFIRPEVYKFMLNGKNSLISETSDKNSVNKGFVLWMTGLSQSGKSTIADKVFEVLNKKDYKVERLDGDVIRESLTKDLGFSKKDRNENIKRVGFLAKLLSRNGVGVIASFISPYKKQRDEIKLKVENYIEVFVNTPIKVCEKRDKKGLYKLAREGKIKNFTGINDPYEKPKNPDIEVRPGEEDIQACVNKIMDYLDNYLK